MEVLHVSSQHGSDSMHDRRSLNSKGYPAMPGSSRQLRSHPSDSSTQPQLDPRRVERDRLQNRGTKLRPHQPIRRRGCVHLGNRVARSGRRQHGGSQWLLSHALKTPSATPITSPAAMMKGELTTMNHSVSNLKSNAQCGSPAFNKCPTDGMLRRNPVSKLATPRIPSLQKRKYPLLRTHPLPLSVLLLNVCCK